MKNHVLTETNLPLPRRVVVAFQPHRYTRLNALWEDFAKSLTRCDYLIVTDVYAAGENPVAGVNASKLIELITDRTTKSVIYIDRKNLVPSLLQIVRGGDIVITMGAGDITAVAYSLYEALQQKKNHKAQSEEWHQIKTQA